jgi:hypothetical protein
MVDILLGDLLSFRAPRKEPSMRALGLIVLVAVLGSLGTVPGPLGTAFGPLGTAGASEVVVYTARHYGQ